MSQNPFKNEPSSTRLALNRIGLRVRNVERRVIESSGGIQFDIDNVGDSLQVETTALVPVDFSEPYAAANPATDYGTAFNVKSGVLFTVPPDSYFNSGNPVVDIEDFKTSGDLGAFGQLIRAEDRTPGGTNDVIGQQIIASADGIQSAIGETVEASMGVAGTADSIAGSFGADNQGSGREIAVLGVAGVSKSGAGALCFLGQDGAGNNVFEARADGSIHVPIGASTAMVADLP